MNWVKHNKNDLLGIGIILILFILSIQVRKENLKAPLGRNHEWITAHALMTAEIWDKYGGPSAYNFSPIYSYPGSGSAYRKPLGGIDAANGNVYYTSYPPFTFIYLYYSSHLTGGPTVFSVRFAALTIHFISAILIFFLIGQLRNNEQKKSFNFAGVIAGGLYLFAQGNLWFHGNLYFADMVVQPFFIGGLLLAIRYLQGNYKNEKRFLLIIFITFFLGTYTEWVSLFSAFFTGLLFLGFALFKKQKKYLRPFVTIAVASSLALGLTILQYSSIDGWEALKTTSSKKYEQRSGHSEKADPRFNINSNESFTMLTDTFSGFYKSTENFVAIAFIVMVLLIILRRIKRFAEFSKTFILKWHLLLIALFVLPILTHYLLFYDFNTKHYFSGLKSGTLLICSAGIIVQIAQAHLKSFHINAALIGVVFFSSLFSLKAYQATYRYYSDNPLESLDMDRIKSAQEIAKHRAADYAIMANVRDSPEQFFYAKHIISPIKDSDTSSILHILELRRNTKGQYYHHEGSVLKSMVTFELDDDNLVFLDTIDFN